MSVAVSSSSASSDEGESAPVFLRRFTDLVGIVLRARARGAEGEADASRSASNDLRFIPDDAVGEGVAEAPARAAAEATAAANAEG